MWKDPEPDPGGETQEGSSSGKPLQELSDLKDQNEQQQLLIAQLKEMLRKEQSNVTQEKVDEYINTLSKAKAKKNRTKKDESSLGKSASTSSIIDVTKKQKLNLLKQQLEENKARLAERGKSQKGIEEMVIQLKAQLNDSQQLIPPNLSIVESKNLEYSKNSSQEELYNILLTKERKITDLLNKVQKQEVTILDLEENLKEKDSVIDARTKAITLMSDSLSKKGKSTLDALDDTKEQMRKMQENFITLESEMKARQVKLLNDLKAKNFEIAELQENNQKLLEEKESYHESTDYKNNEAEDFKNIISGLQVQLNQMLTENEAHTKRISELEKTLQDSEDDLNRLKSVGMSVTSEQNQDEEIAKLKKQLEEANKSMIKVKAQSKSKIKELNKKLDQIKKVSDANALIVQLQNENTKLSEKIAELEEEKGNMQLKMVESSDSIKDSSQLEELENKIRQNSDELEEKEKIISLLETEIISLKEETSSLNEKISSLSHLENMQVSTEIRGIQLEEQLEKVENENLKLKEEIEKLLREKEEMAEHMEELKKEKQDISTKLDNYIQENMELIDKLEKLSAEKVSSAESIEIVEGLTQQEKLELAAYQKNIDSHIEGEPMKCSEDDQIEPPTELNESVLQLSEDSSELLQKIDMFNMERKEVMTKMDALKDENAQLNIKLKEIENNRDILAETYEQLQTEKEVLQTEKDDLLKKIQEQSEVGSGKDEDIGSILVKLQELQEDYEKLLKENENLKSNLKEHDKHMHEKHNLELELKQAREKLEEFQTKINDNIEEIMNYQTVIEENKNELINYANLINDLQTKLTAREKDVADLNVIINDLNEVVKDLQTENAKLGIFEVVETQMMELKAALNDQIQQAQEYEEESTQNNNVISGLNTKLIQMNKRMIEVEHDMEMKGIEYKKLSEDLQIKNEIIRDLQQQVQEKDNKVGAIIQEMKEKYLSLQKQLDGNNGSLEAKIVELTNKNKEQMEKMKKIAANLKKKSQAYQELEEKYNEQKEKWETEVNEKESIISNSQEKITTILQQLNELQEEIKIKNARIANSETKIKELNEAIENLEQSRAELQNSVIELRHREQKLTEVSLKQELSTSLHEEFDDIPSNQDSAKEEKIKELELIIETNEADIAHFSDRIHKLEEHIAHLEQEKETLIQKTAELSDQLNLTSKSVEEKSFLEEELGQKLLQVTANDEVLMKKMEEVTEENREFLQKNKELEEMNLKLKVKLKKAHERVTQLKTLQANMEELESINGELKKQLAVLEANQKHIQDENLELQKQNQNDYERIEADYQVQLEELVGCRNELTVECEKLRESLKEREQREEDLLSEIKDYKQKMEEINQGNKDKLEELGDELRVSTFNWKDSVKEIGVLNEQIEYLRKELINKIARETVESIVTEAEARVRSMRTISSQTEATEIIMPEVPVREPALEPKIWSSSAVQPEIVPTFHWPDGQPVQPTTDSKDWFGDATNTQQAASNDWFSGSSQIVNIPPDPPQSEPQQLTTVENSKEELLNKIKALEFLLYNIDKEKEQAFEECTGMVDQLTRLLYEKVNKEVSTAVKPKSDQPLSEMESQIMSELDVTDAASHMKELHNIEFEKTNASFGEQIRPVVEEVMQPKRAYLTYQPEDKVPVVKPELFGENDDGWGWGPEEAKLEEEHQFRTESEPQVQSLRNEIARLNETLQVLQMERENHLEEIKQLQVKSGKLIKKCKELKHKNDQLVEKQQAKKSEGADFFDLDAAIQEELKTQIAQLEKKIKEISNELEKEKHEKANVLKRVDVLTSANDRMTEMKEIQDTEVLRWKRKYQEVEEKLQQYEWGSDGFNEGSKPKEAVDVGGSSSQDTSKIEELQQTIKELSLDNDELQALLEEQRQLRIDLEKTKPIVDTGKKDFETLELENRIKHLEQDLALKTEEMQKVLSERNNVYAQTEELQKAIMEKEESIRQLQENLSGAIQQNKEFENQLAQNDKLVKDLQENEKGHKEQDVLVEKVKELEAELWQLNQWKAQQDHLLQEKEKAYNEIIFSLEQANMLKEELNNQVKQLTNDLEQTRQKYDELQAKSSRNILELQQEIAGQREIFDGLKAQLDEKLSELEQQKQGNLETATKVTQLSQELQDQTQKYEELQVEFNKKVTEVARLSQELQDKKVDSSVKDPFEWAQEKYQLESSLMEKEATIVELRSQKEHLEKEIGLLKNTLELKQREYEQVINETEEKISRAAKELEESWIIQVDQRGTDVAESWKLHLESVEAEFASIQEKLKYEINELEEKCNALVNENNELRKNVDAEIRNEVDRISALSQQITDGQRFITELNNKLLEKQSENESLMGKFRVVENEKDQILKDLRDKEAKLSGLSIIVDTTQKQFDEKREVVEEIVRILEKNTTFPISFEKEDVLNEFQRQLNLLSVKDQDILQLNQSIKSLQDQLGSVQNTEGEIIRLNQLVQDLQSQLDLLPEKDNEIFKLNKLVEESQKQLLLLHEKDEEILNMNRLVEDLQQQLPLMTEKDTEITRMQNFIMEQQGQLASVQGRDEEIARLNEIVETYKDQYDANQQELDKYRQEYANTNMAIENYQQRLDEVSASYMTLQNSLEEKNQLIATLNQQLQLTESLKNDNNKDVENLHEELSQVKKDCSMLQQSLADCQEQLFKVTSELTNKTNELERVNDELVYSQQNFVIKECKSDNLERLLQGKSEEHKNYVENVRTTRVRDLENHYEELAAKDLDIETIRSQLNESIQHSNQLMEKLNVEESVRKQLEDKVKVLEEKMAEQNALADEEDHQLSELRTIIEQQVMKIEELKKELFAKSSDYDSLIAEMDIGRRAITQQPTTSAMVEKPSTTERPQLPEEDLSEPVSRAELDLALYMLHQRDVRCEELTVELTQLLEERDTLQLRLSNALREKEETRRKLLGSEEAPLPSSSSSSPATPLSKSSTIFLAASGTELATEPSETSSDVQNLESKLSELRMVGYKKDKTFVDEQEFRRLQQMSIMQQHINEASKLPPEAAAKLVDASYTLSRDVQSPSKVLLNWLWGRSTPKVNDT